MTSTKKMSLKKKANKTPIKNGNGKSSGSQPKTGVGVGSRKIGSNGGPSDVKPIVEKVDSEEDKEYVYESEAFVSPISSDEEGVNRHKWTERIAGKLVKVIVRRPDFTPKEAKQHMSEVYKIQIHEKMITRALKRARENVIGKEGEQYSKLHDYVAELLKSNHGTTVLLSTLLLELFMISYLLLHNEKF
ncbi:hypothetical protein PIB30_049886 [Stylosanthes scabra]|uniref:Uncharacterized protein n=1 Tax=Stylosanthes scabra TaxID=79078 RepID=A0ABU6WHF9_9FABA|nr:hypothetical protein [Stylosanthes scabra]